jgi:hypothetical protein
MMYDLKLSEESHLSITKISQFYIALLIKQYIFRLQVPINYARLVELFQGTSDLDHYMLCLSFCKCAHLSEVLV